jgi:hypothetical protein
MRYFNCSKSIFFLLFFGVLSLSSQVQAQGNTLPEGKTRFFLQLGQSYFTDTSIQRYSGRSGTHVTMGYLLGKSRLLTRRGKEEPDREASIEWVVNSVSGGLKYTYPSTEATTYTSRFTTKGLFYTIRIPQKRNSYTGIGLGKLFVEGKSSYGKNSDWDITGNFLFGKRFTEGFFVEAGYQFPIFRDMFNSSLPGILYGKYDNLKLSVGYRF